MAKKQSRRSISVRGVTYNQLREHCGNVNISISDFLEQRIVDYFTANKITFNGPGTTAKSPFKPMPRPTISARPVAATPQLQPIAARASSPVARPAVAAVQPARPAITAVAQKPVVAPQRPAIAASPAAARPAFNGYRPPAPTAPMAPISPIRSAPPASPPSPAREIPASSTMVSRNPTQIAARRSISTATATPVATPAPQAQPAPAPRAASAAGRPGPTPASEVLKDRPVTSANDPNDYRGIRF